VIKRNDSNTLLRNLFDGSRTHFVYDINSCLHNMNPNFFFIKIPIRIDYVSQN